MKNKKGFTLIELLIVISIVGMLSVSVFYTNYLKSLQRARDSQRKTDMAQIASILEEYHNDNNYYPSSDGNGNIKVGNDVYEWGKPFAPYTQHLPDDPIKNQEYYYTLKNANQTKYSLFAKLEISDDPDIEPSGCQNGCGPDNTYNYKIETP